MPATTTSAADFLPAVLGLPALTHAAQDCRGCELYADATQTVFGEGRVGARVVLVGEQPGDKEDRAGHPFVGPAGAVLDEALEAAGVVRRDAYVTNAVKHFRWKPDARGGSRRLHATPSAGQATACRPWLAAELQAVQPELVVALGATAARSLFGPSFRLTQRRGELIDWPPTEGPFVAPTPDLAAAAAGDAEESVGPSRALATIHPSAVLRSDDRDTAMAGLVDDLRVVADFLK